MEEEQPEEGEAQMVVPAAKLEPDEEKKNVYMHEKVKFFRLEPGKRIHRAHAWYYYDDTV